MTDHSVLLKERIAFLEDRQRREIAMLKDQVIDTYESLQPINLLRDNLEKITSQSDLKNNILEGMIGVAAGYVSKKILVGSSQNPVRKIIGTLFQIGVTTFVAQNSGKIKAIGEVMTKHLFSHEILNNDVI